MALVIQEANLSNLQDANRVDGSIWIDSRLSLSAVDGKIAYTVVPVQGYLQPYVYGEAFTAEDLGNPDRALFFAYLDGSLAGQVTLHKKWNRFAWVEDFVVDLGCRRRGAGQALMERAVEWARQKGLPGIMLETQDNRVAACMFYERYGFELAGFDRLLYRAFPADAGQIALFWYLVF
jgi:streptothricin acetyltransferase